jgi:oxygen-independent coproporphyrinogen-3 oxidase
VTRLSIGAQSLDAGELRSLGRRHEPGDVGAAVEAARSGGIRSISADLLFDVPNQTLASWIDTVDAAIALDVDHLSLYALSLDDPVAEGLTGPLGDHLPTTAGARRWRQRARVGQDEDRAVAMYHHALVELAAAGFESYEISNWARPRHESRHNRLYWARQPVEALGPGAHAFDGVTRRWTAASLDGYLAALLPADGEPPRLPAGGTDRLDPDTARAERLILGLRTSDGVALDQAFEPPLADAFGWALGSDLLEVFGPPEAERLRLTTRGRLLSNELFARLV